MNRHIGLALFALAAVLLGTPAAQAQFTVQPDKENVVASKLVGTWETDPELNQRLGMPERERVIFTNDPAVAARIPAMYEKGLKGKQIYLAGMMTLRQKEYPYILIEHRGNPHVVWFRERGGDPLGDAESFNVMLAVAKDTQNDLLFIGGDFNNQPFSAFRRVKAAGK